MNRIACSIFAVLLLSPASTRGARNYNIVNYPLDQDGYTLAGTITTTDDAPLNSMLDVAEILEWQWEITGPFSFSASSSDYATDLTFASGVRISPQAIELPLVSSAGNVLTVLSLTRMSLLSSGRRDHLLHEIRWDNYSNSDSHIPQYVARRAEGDFGELFWETDGASLGDST